MIYGTIGNTKAILTLSAIAVALLLAGAPQQAAAGEAAAITSNKTNMSSLSEAMCSAPDLKSAAENYFTRCPTGAEELPGECIAAQFEGSPGNTGGYNPDAVLALLKNCDEEVEHAKLGIGKMEQAYLDAVIASPEGEKNLRDYLGLASLIAAIEHNNPDSDRLPAFRTKAEALKEELMAVMIPGEEKASDNAKAMLASKKDLALYRLTAEVILLNNADARAYAESQ